MRLSDSEFLVELSRMYDDNSVNGSVNLQFKLRMYSLISSYHPSVRYGRLVFPKALIRKEGSFQRATSVSRQGILFFP